MANITTLNLNGTVYLMDRETARAVVRARNADEVNAVLFYQLRNGHARLIGKL